MAEAAALAGPLDETGDVGDGERRLARGHHAQVGHEGGERVVGDLGPGPRHRRDQAGLAGAGEPHQADVGDHLELEADLQLVARLAEQREARRLALGARQRGVAEATAAAAGDHQLGAGADHVGQHLARPRVVDDRAVGHGQHQVAAVAAVAVPAGALRAVLGLAARAVVVVEQRGDVRVDPEDHRAAGTAVPAVGAAERLELLPVHRGDAVPAAAGADVQRDAVHERRDCHGITFRWLRCELRASEPSQESTKGAPSRDALREVSW